MYKSDAINELADELRKYELVSTGMQYTFEELQSAIAKKMNFLITNNFSLLISFLYRLDISEKKLKALLNQSGNAPAGDIIATLIIERQLQKIEARKTFRSTDFCDEEKW